MKKVCFKVVCILAIVFPETAKWKTPSFASCDYTWFNKKMRQLMLRSIVMIAGLFVLGQLSSQWERIPPFNIGCNDMVLAHKDTTLISLVQVNDSTLFASGWNFLLITQNLGGPTWPIKSVKPEIIVDLSVYPNPATDFIKVKGRKEDFDYQIFDIQGRVVNEGRCEGFSEIRLDSLQEGSHLLMIRTEELSTCFLIMIN